MRLCKVGSVDATQCDGQTAQTSKNRHYIFKKLINPPTIAREKWYAGPLKFNPQFCAHYSNGFESYERLPQTPESSNTRDPVAIEAHTTLNQVVMKDPTKPAA